MSDEWSSVSLNSSLSVLIPAYNESEYIEQTLRSVIASAKNWQGEVRIIVFDNGSTDKTNSIIRQIQAEHAPLVLLESRINMGSRYSWTHLLSAVTTDFFIILGAHDWISDNYLNLMQKTLSENVDVAVFGREIMVVETDSGWIEKPIENYLVLSKNSLLKALQLVFFQYHNSIAHSIFPSNIIGKIPLQKIKVIHFDLVLSFYFFSQVSLTYNFDAKFYRRYRNQIDGYFAHINSAGEIEDRVERVIGASSELFSDEYISKELVAALHDFLPKCWNAPVEYILRGKYRLTGLSWFAFRSSRFIFGKILRQKANFKFAKTDLNLLQL